MILSDFVEWLDRFFAIETLDGKTMIDSSMISRIGLIPPTFRSKCNESFLKRMNGLLYGRHESINSLLFATFLSDEVVDNVVEQYSNGALLIVHHLFDMNCGTPDEMDGVPFRFLSETSIQKLNKNKIYIYAAHLPFDLQSCQINTSREFVRNLGISNVKPLQLQSISNIGYYTEEFFGFIDEDIKGYRKYGAEKHSFPKKVAIIAGVLSNCRVLQELEDSGFDALICGDIFVCIPSERFNSILTYSEKTKLEIYCFSHYHSEKIALKALASKMSREFDFDQVYFIEEQTLWK